MLTDIKGFTSRTSSLSRSETMGLLKKHKELLSPFFEKHSGRIVKTIGDAFLVVFESPTDAVLCGVEIQDMLKKYNEDKEPANKIEIRIAINSGEVSISDDGDVFGDAVNITSRLESIAEVGQVFFTEAVYLAMNKKEVPSSEIGYRQFKGVPEKIKVYRVLKETPIGNGLAVVENNKESLSGQKIEGDLNLAGLSSRFWALFMDLIIFGILIGMLGIKSCRSNANYYQKNDGKEFSNVGKIDISRDGINIVGENGEEVKISRSAIDVISSDSKKNQKIKRRQDKGISIGFLLWVIYCGFMIWRFGATPGKMLFKIKVVDYVDGGNVSADKAFIRSFFSLVSLFFFLGYLWAFKNKDKRTWHDLIAGTKVVSVK